MANIDSITKDSNVISWGIRLPRVSIPKDVAEGDYGRIVFKIETHNGTIDVSSWGTIKFECRGTVSALEAGGFLRPDWCPGLPGNNKTRQTVLFEAEGVRLIYGNRASKKLPAPFIVIKRESANKFAVEVPTTKEQQELLSQVRERCTQQQNDARQNERERQYKEQCREIDKAMYSSPVIFKDRAISSLNLYQTLVMNELSGKREFADYGETTIWLDDHSMQEVICAGARFIEAIRIAKVVCRRKESRLSIVK